MNRHPLSVIDIPPACPGTANFLGLVLAGLAPQLDHLIRFPWLCPLVRFSEWHDGCDRQDYQKGVSPVPSRGGRAPDDGSDQLS